MRLIATAVTLAVFCFGVVNAEQPNVKKQPPTKKGLDLGVVNLDKDKFKKTDLAVPAADAKVPQVGLKAIVTGQTAKDESVFVAVNAIGSEDAKGIFWVQKLPKTDGGKFRAECQFGEGGKGKGEYFAVVAFTSKSTEIVTGDQLDFDALQKAATSYSAVLIVQRKK